MQICISGWKILFIYCQLWSSPESIICFCFWPRVLLAAVLPHHSKTFTLLQLLSRNKRPNSRSSRDAFPMTYCTVQAWNMRLLTTMRECKIQVRCHHRRDEMGFQGSVSLATHCHLLLFIKTVVLPSNRLPCLILSKNRVFRMMRDTFNGRWGKTVSYWALG